MYKVLHNIWLMVRSSLFLVLVFATVILIQWGCIQFAAYVSGIEGELLMDGTSAVPDNWSQSQVLWIHLFPYAVFVLLFMVMIWKRKFPVELPTWIQLIHSWSFVIVLLYVFFMPLVEIITKQGIYHVLNWMHIDRYLALVIGILFWVFFLYKSFIVAALFSTTLEVPDNHLIGPKQIRSQLPRLWYVPLMVLTLVIYLFSDFSIPTSHLYFLLGLVFVIIINTWYIGCYSVIVR